MRTTHVQVEAVFGDADHWQRFRRTTGQLQMWRAVPEQHRDEVEAEVHRRLDALRDPSGRIVLRQDVRVTLARA